jgi:hypothetical protein
VYPKSKVILWPVYICWSVKKCHVSVPSILCFVFAGLSLRAVNRLFRFVAAQKALAAADIKSWETTLALVIDDFVKRMRPVVEPKPVLKVGAIVVGAPWLPTYDFGSSKSSMKLYLPIDRERKITDLRARWLWVHACEKREIPPSLGDPHPAQPWPKFLYLWVGPDGHPIRKDKEALLIKWRKGLNQRQTQSKISSPVKEIGVLRADKETYGIVEPDPIWTKEK